MSTVSLQPVETLYWNELQPARTLSPEMNVVKGLRSSTMTTDVPPPYVLKSFCIGPGEHMGPKIL